jgi:hypothetical protein
MAMDKDHGRLAVRHCRASDDRELADWFDPRRSWPGLRDVACVAGERWIGGR